MFEHKLIFGCELCVLRKILEVEFKFGCIGISDVLNKICIDRYKCVCFAFWEKEFVLEEHKQTQSCRTKMEFLRW